MIGRRIFTYSVHDRAWYGYCPGPGRLIANLARHDVTEHMDDRTISVLPSIECTNGRLGNRWHGYLERGVWKECT